MDLPLSISNVNGYLGVNTDGEQRRTQLSLFISLHKEVRDKFCKLIRNGVCRCFVPELAWIAHHAGQEMLDIFRGLTSLCHRVLLDTIVGCHAGIGVSTCCCSGDT